jgi:hypothetical protein
MFRPSIIEGGEAKFDKIKKIMGKTNLYLWRICKHSTYYLLVGGLTKIIIRIKLINKRMKFRIS